MIFKHVIADTSSIYGVTHAGELLWHRDLRKDGTNGAHGESGWDPRSGNQIGIGWDQFNHVFSGGASDFVGSPSPRAPRSLIYGIKP
jgi:hypothetical protein